jgi:hypothetical protein
LEPSGGWDITGLNGTRAVYLQEMSHEQDLVRRGGAFGIRLTYRCPRRRAAKTLPHLKEHLSMAEKLK